MLTAAEFAQLLAVAGEPCVFVQSKTPNTVTALSAIVQTLNKADEALVNAYGVTGRSIQIAANALTIPPEKFDRVSVGGEIHVLDTVLPQHERGTGNVAYFLCYAKGK